MNIISIKKLIGQILRFLLVGVLAFLIDYGLLVFLKETVNLNLFLSTEIAFVLSTIVNYLFSVHFVFKVNRKNNNLIPFLALSFAGLLLTEAIMFIGVEKIKINYLIVKIFATAVVMFFNFITRKMLLEKH